MQISLIFDKLVKTEVKHRPMQININNLLRWNTCRFISICSKVKTESKLSEAAHRADLPQAVV